MAAIGRDRGWADVLAAAALQGAAFGPVKAIGYRVRAQGLERATGASPSD